MRRRLSTVVATAVAAGLLPMVLGIVGGTGLSPARAADAQPVWAWGRAGQGLLGTGSTTGTTEYVTTDSFGNSNTVSGTPAPARVPNLSASAVAGGLGHAVALLADGSVSGWGDADNGANGFDTRKLVPTPLGFTGVKAVEAGGVNSIALKTDGTVWTWGNNLYGQLGTGTTDANVHTTPVRVTSFSGTATAVDAGDTSYALRSDGTVWAWGKNNAGQVGNGKTTNVSSPVQVKNITSVKAISAGENWAMALRTDGTVWAWGQNTFGQLGNNTTTNSSVPVQVTGLSGVTAVAAGGSNAVALKADGTVWTWGDATVGQLGNGSSSTNGQKTPVQVPGLGGVVSVARGWLTTVAVRYDRTAWAWGFNSGGQVGQGPGKCDGTNHCRAVPTQVPGLGGTGAIGMSNEAAFSIGGTTIAPNVPPTGGPVAPVESYGGRSPSQRWCVCTVNNVTYYPVSTASGNFWHTFEDMAVPGRGVPLHLTHSYNSGAAGVDGPLGFGWTHSYAMSLTIGTSTVTVNEEGGSQVTFTQSGSTYTAPPRVTAELVRNPDGTFRFTRGAKKIFDFDADGRPTAQRDRNGNVTTITYPNASTMVVTDPGGRAFMFTSSAGRINSVTDSSTPARTVSFDYDGSGNLTDVTDVGGGNTHFTYDGSHRMLTMRLPRQTGVVTNHYDASGRVDWQSDQLGRTTFFDYTSLPGATKVTAPNGTVVVDAYENGVLVSQTKGYGSPVAATWYYTHDPDSLGVSSTTDPNGRTSTRTFDDRGNVLTSTDPLDRTTTSVFNALDDPTSVTGPDDVTTTMTYDANGNILTRSRPLLDDTGATVDTQTITYTRADAAHPDDVTSVTDAEGNVWTNGFDTFGNVLSEQAPPTPENPAGNTTTHTYNTARGLRTSTVSPLGNVAGGNPALHTTTFEHDAFGNVTVVKDPLWRASDPTKHRTVSHFDAEGHVDYTIDGNNNRTDFTHDAAGQLATVTRADGTQLSTVRDGAGNVVRTVDGAGAPTSWTFDAQNRPTAMSTYVATVTGDGPAGYWRLGESSGTTAADASGNGRNGTYSASGVTLSAPGSLTGDGDTAASFNGTTGSVSVADNDAFSPHTGLNGAITVEASVTLAALPASSAVIVGKGTSANWEYQLSISNTGQPSFTVWQLGGQNPSVYSTAAGGTVTVGTKTQIVGVLRKGQFTRLYLNGTQTAQSTSFTGSTGNGTAPLYVARRSSGLYLNGTVDEVAVYPSALSPARVLAHYQGTRGTSYVHDPAGNRTLVTDPDGGSTASTFDAADRLVSVDYSDTTPDVTNIEYDDLDRRTAITDGTGTSRWSWDSLGRLKSSTDGSGAVVGYAHDLRSLVTSIDYPGAGRIVTRDFDDAGRMEWVEDWAGNRTTFGHDADSRLVGQTLPAGTGVADTTSFDDAGDITGTTVTRLGVPVATLGWGRDGAGMVASSTATGVPPDNHTFDYTALQQLAHSDLAAWGYDAADNPVTLGSGARQGFDRENRLCWSTPTAPVGSPTCAAPPTGATIFGYDAPGNRTSVTPPSGPATNLGWDRADRLTSFGTNATYAYDGTGLRASKTVSGVTSRFVWDRSGALPLLLSDGTSTWVYGPDGLPLEQIDGSGNVLWLHHDQLGSTRVVTDALGNTAATFSWDPFGNPAGSTGTTAVPLGWAGEYRDAESGLVYLRARYYDPATAQFLSVDPAYEVTGSRYDYVGNDPLNGTDPTGLWRDCGRDKFYDSRYDACVDRDLPPPSYAAPDTSISAPSPAGRGGCTGWLCRWAGILGPPVPPSPEGVAAFGGTFAAGVCIRRLNLPGWLLTGVSGLAYVVLGYENPRPGTSVFSERQDVTANGIPYF